VQLPHAFGDGPARGGLELSGEADAVLAAPGENQEERLVSHHELHQDGACIREQRIDVRALRWRHQAAPCAERGHSIEERLLLRRALRGRLDDGRVEARDPRGIRFRQAALARDLRVERHELARECSLVFALAVGHAPGNVALPRRQQHAKIVNPHPLRRLEGGGRVAVFGLQQREHGECGRGITRDWSRRPDLCDFEEAIDGRDGGGGGSDGRRPVPQASQGLGFRHLRAPQHVVVREGLGTAAGARGRV
jgi:hypothetical protein